MISTGVIIMLALTALVYIGVLVALLTMSKKQKGFLKTMGIGFVIYFVYQMILSVYVGTVGDGSYLLRYFASAAILLLSVNLVLKFVSGKIDDSILEPKALTLGYSIMTILQGFLLYVSLFMGSFAVNKGELATAYPELSAAELEKFISTLNSLSVGSLFATIFGFAISILVFVFATKCILDYIRNQEKKTKLLYAFEAFLTVNFIPSLIVMVVGDLWFVLLIYYILVGLGCYYLFKNYDKL